MGNVDMQFWYEGWVDTVGTRQNDRHFVIDIFKFLFFLKVVFRCKFYQNLSTTVQSKQINIGSEMAWHRTGHKSLIEPMFTDINALVCLDGLIFCVHTHIHTPINIHMHGIYRFWYFPIPSLNTTILHLLIRYLGTFLGFLVGHWYRFTHVYVTFMLINVVNVMISWLKFQRE